MFPPSELAVVTGLFDLVNFHRLVELHRFRKSHLSLAKTISQFCRTLHRHSPLPPVIIHREYSKLEMWQPAPIPSCMPLNGQCFGGRLGPKSVPIYGSCLDNSREMMSIVVYLGECNMVERRITKIIRRNQWKILSNPNVNSGLHKPYIFIEFVLTKIAAL